MFEHGPPPRLRKRAALPRFALAALCVSACSNNLTPEWKLTDFRVLAVRADPPQPAPGASTQVTLDSADPASRTVQVGWVLCNQTAPVMGSTDAGVADAGCSLVPSFGPTATIQIPATGTGVDLSGNPAVTLLGFACAGGQITLPSDGGVTPQCVGADAGMGWQFTRSIPLQTASSQNPANQNPSISEVRFGIMGSEVAITADAPPTVPVCADQSGASTCTTWNVQVLFTDGSREPYIATDPLDGGVATHNEHLTVGYVVDDGTLGGGFRTDTDVDPVTTMDDSFRAPATAEDVHLYIVASDNRGGFDWTMRTIHVQ